LDGNAVAVELLLAGEGRVRLCGMEVASITVQYRDGSQAILPIAWQRALAGSEATVLPKDQASFICERPAGVITVELDSKRQLEHIVLQVLVSDMRLILYGMNLLDEVIHLVGEQI
jgi:hypothetical protein